MNFIEVCNTYFYQWGVLNTVLWKQTDGVKICFVLYLEKVKKQCCTESFLGGNKSCTQVNRTNLCWFFLGGGMAFNTTFNNISVISCQPVLLLEESGVPGENHRPATSHWQALSHNVVSNTPRLSWIRTHNVSGDRHWLHR
jgi:hypothetical protein